MSTLPTHFKNPFVSDTEYAYKTYDIFERLNLNMLYVVPFNRIFVRTKPHIKKQKIVSADYRYPGILYKSKLDPENNMAYHNRSIAKEMIGDLMGACSDAKQAVLLGDSDVTNKNWINVNC